MELRLAYVVISHILTARILGICIAFLTLCEYAYVSSFRFIFEPLNSDSLDMATLGMWKLVQLFGRLYGDKLYLLPYKTSISNRQMLLIRNISRKRRYFKIFCTLCAFGHTLFCFASLCKPFFTRKGQTDPFLPGMSEAVRVVRVYVQILAALLPSTFLPMSYVIAFRPVVAEVILCKIIQFQKETQGNHGHCMYTSKSAPFLIRRAVMLTLVGFPLHGA